jgi:hypothetical protein
MSRKSDAYWAGYDAEAARIGRTGNLEQLAATVSRQFARDESRKTRILQRSPYVFAAVDAEELSQASSRELATRELKELGIEAGANDPLAILDAHHAGRAYARGRNRLVGGGHPGSAQDASEDNFMNRYLNESKE